MNPATEKSGLLSVGDNFNKDSSYLKTNSKGSVSIGGQFISPHRYNVEPKTKRKFISSLGEHSFRFQSRIQTRVNVNSFKKCIPSQCRICGLHPIKCLKIFESSFEIIRMINTYLPIKVTYSDRFPKTVCLECIGILQTMDDLAYRSYLVEVSFQNIYNIPANCNHLIEKKCISKSTPEVPEPAAKVSKETMNTQLSQVPTRPIESTTTSPTTDPEETESDDGMDYDVLVPEVNIQTSNVQLKFVSEKTAIANYTKNDLPKVKDQRRKPLADFEGLNKNNKTNAEIVLMRNLIMHSYAKPSSEEPISNKKEEDEDKDKDTETKSLKKKDSIYFAKSTHVLPDNLISKVNTAEPSSNDSVEQWSDVNLHSYAKKPAEEITGVVSETTNTTEASVIAKVARLVSREFLGASAKAPLIGNSSSNQKRKKLLFRITRINKAESKPINPPVSNEIPLRKIAPNKNLNKIPSSEISSHKIVSNEIPSKEIKKTSPPEPIKKKKVGKAVHGCYICSKKFAQFSLLLAHMQTHSAAEKCCPVCEKVFDHVSLQPLLRHRKIHSETELKKWTSGSEVKTNFQCETCSKFFINRIHRIFHNIYHHELKLLPCEFCEGEFTAETLEKHRDICGITRKNCKRTCNVCSAECQNSMDYLKHIQTHVESCTCDYCSATFISSRLLENHIEVDHAVKPHSCDICDKAFIVQSSLAQHQKSFHPKSKSEYVCGICKKTFRAHQNLVRHKRTHTKRERYQCAVCAEVFTSNMDLCSHRQTHSELVCHLCNQACIDEEKYFAHMKRCAIKREDRLLKRTNALKDVNGGVIHKKYSRKKKKNLECPTCQRKFPSGSSLRRHVSIHTGERPHMCAECGKTYRTRELLLTHSRRHSDEKRYACQFCSESFTAMDGLYNHKRLNHTDRFKYKCGICTRFYNSRKHFVIHMQMCLPFEEVFNESAENKAMRCLICPKVFRTEITLKNHESRVHDENHPPICKVCAERCPSVCSLRKHVERHFNNNEIKNINCPKCDKICADDNEFEEHKCSEEPANTDKEAPVSAAVASIIPSTENLTKEPSSMESLTTIAEITDPENLKSPHQKDTSSNEISELDDYVSLLNKCESEIYNTVSNDLKSKDANSEGMQSSAKNEVLPSVLNHSKEKSEDNTIFVCTFCGNDFYDNSVFLRHLENDHGYKLDSLKFHLKEA